MRILVNAIPLTLPYTGIGRYLASLYNAIEQCFPEVSIEYFDGRKVSPTPPESGEKQVLGFLAKCLWMLPKQVGKLVRNWSRSRHERAFASIASGYDLYHEAGYFPLSKPENTHVVLTVHDMSLLVRSSDHPAERVAFFRQGYGKGYAMADGILTPSKFTATELEICLPELAVPVLPVPLGCDTAHFYPRDRDRQKSLAHRLNLPEQYIVFVGTQEPRKNIRTIRYALRILREQYQLDIPLVCTGWKGWGRNSAAQGVFTTGHLSEDDLPVLYSGSTALVFPSYYEGFGLPLVEAMACGCPVISSDRTSLPEVGGEAVMYCSPDSPADWATAIRRLWTDDDLCRELKKRGLERVQSFTWERAARETMRFFGEICGQEKSA